jgi:hypothetical protein
LNSAVVARLKALGAEVVIERLKTGDFRIGASSSSARQFAISSTL